MHHPSGTNSYPVEAGDAKGTSDVICPLKNRHINPSRCLLCPHFGGLKNQGVLCFKANRHIKYEIVRRNV